MNKIRKEKYYADKPNNIIMRKTEHKNTEKPHNELERHRTDGISPHCRQLDGSIQKTTFLQELMISTRRIYYRTRRQERETTSAYERETDKIKQSVTCAKHIISDQA